jgi:fructokinase
MTHRPQGRRTSDVTAALEPPDQRAGWALGIGEILWDLLPDGPRLGGAPFNVVAHLRRLGHGAAFLTAVGDDELGRRALTAMADAGIETSMVAVATAETGTAGVELDTAGNPTFVIHSPVAYELATLDGTAASRIRTEPPVAIVFGTLAQRSATVRATTSAVFDAAPGSMRVYDVNLRDGAWTVPLAEELLGDANVLKLNAGEVRILAPLLGLPAKESLFAEAVARGFGLESVCVTRGSDGAMLWLAGSMYEAAGVRVTVADTIGAGDAFTAGLVDGLLRGRDPHATLATANALGAFVASRSGAVPPWSPADLASLGAVLDEVPGSQGRVPGRRA